MANVFLTSSHL